MASAAFASPAIRISGKEDNLARLYQTFRKFLTGNFCSTDLMFLPQIPEVSFEWGSPFKNLTIFGFSGIAKRPVTQHFSFFRAAKHVHTLAYKRRFCFAQFYRG